MLQNFWRGVAWGIDPEREWRKAFWGRECCLLGFPESRLWGEFSMQDVHLGWTPMEEKVKREE